MIFIASSCEVRRRRDFSVLMTGELDIAGASEFHDQLYTAPLIYRFALSPPLKRDAYNRDGRVQLFKIQITGNSGVAVAEAACEYLVV